MTRLTKVVLLVVLVPRTSPAQADFWTHTNSGPWGAINAIALNQGQVLTCGAGIFRSTNNGQFWSRINYEFNFHTVNSVSVDSSENFFAGTTGGIYYSSDQGSTWIQKGLSNSTVYWWVKNTWGDLRTFM